MAKQPSLVEEGRLLEDDGELTEEEAFTDEALEFAEANKGKPLGKRVNVRVAKNVRHVFSLKAAPEELDEMADAAEAAGVSVGAFIREAALEKARALKAGRGEELTPAQISAQLAEMARAVRKLEKAGKR